MLLEPRRGVRASRRTARGRRSATPSRCCRKQAKKWLLLLDTASAQVGAASCALAREPALCTSLKSNLGHLEAAAAAAGLSSLIAGPLLAGTVAVNAQLRRLVIKMA